MTRARSVGAALIVILALVAGISATQAGGQGKGGSDAIKAIADKYVKAALANDAKAIAALYADDAVEMPPNQPMVKGKAAIQAYYEKEFSGGTKMTAFTVSHLDSSATGDHGYDVGTYQQTVSLPNASTVSDTGKYTVIVKRVGSEWKVAYAIYNSDQPPPQK